MHVGGTAVVLCALPVEYQAVRPLLTDLQVRELPGGSLFEEGLLSGTPWRVALGQLGEGNVGAGILAERAIRFFLPDLVLFVGVAGALKDDVLVGDVVVATRIDAYQGGKAAEDFLARPRAWDADHRLEQRARHLMMTGGWPPEGLTRMGGAAPVAHLKPIAAGDVVLASRDSPLYEQLRLHYNDAVAIEMEGVGLAQAAHINDALPALVIRGISDTTGPDKQTLDAAGWQARAAGHAASFAAALLRSLPPASLPRRQASPGGATGTRGPAGRIVRLPAERRHLPDLAGQQDLLARLDQQLTRSGPGERLPVVLTGIGGVGKTQLAVEHAHTHRDALDVVWTVRAESLTIAGQDYAALAAALQLPGADDSDLTVAAELTRAWLTGHDRWLLICDNAANPADIDPLLPAEISGQVLVTSRNPAWPSRYTRLAVDTLPTNTAATLLLARTGQTDQASAQLLADELGGLPLALEQAAAYCTQTGLTLTSYRQLNSATPAKLLDKATQPGQATVTATVTLAAQHVRDLNPAAAALLDLLAYLAPDAIPRTLLLGTYSDDHSEVLGNGDAQAPRPAGQPAPPSSKETLPDPAPAAEDQELREAVEAFLAPLDALEDDLAISDTIGLLHRYGLLTATADTLTVHRLTQTVLRATHTPLQHRAFALAAANTVWDILPDVDHATWPIYEQLLPHALAAADHAADLPDTGDTWLSLLLTAGAYLADRGRSAAAEPVVARVLKLAEARAASDDDADLISPLLLLGRVRRDRGDLEGAQPLFERALAIAEASYGPDHPNLLFPLNNLGTTVRDRGDPAAAQPLLERSLAIAEASYGPDHPNLIGPLNNLGDALRDQGDPAAAQPLFERALQVAEASYGPDSQQALAPLSRLGNLHSAAGRAGQAVEYHTRALANTQRHYPPEHRETRAALGNLATTLQSAGRPADALPLRQQMLATTDNTDPPDLGRLTNDLITLAETLRSLDLAAGAIPHLERALAIAEGSAGQDGKVVRLLIMLADCYQRQHRPDLAVHRLRHAVTVTGTIHGEQALQQSGLLRTLADALAAAGDPDEAILALTRLQGLHDRYGAYHAGVADDLRTLADLLMQQGRPKEALPHLQEAIDIDRQYQQQDPAPLILDLTTGSILLDLAGDDQQAEALRAELSRLTGVRDHG